MTALLLVKASVLLSVTLLAVFLLRRASAASRHRLWTVAFTALLALPLLSVALPALDVPAPAGWIAPAPRPAATGASAPQSPDHQVRAVAGTVATSPNGSAAAGAVALTSRLPPTQDVASASSPARRATVSISTLLFAIWLLGAMLAAGMLAASLLRVRRLARAAAAVTDPAWHAAAAGFGARLGLRRSVRLLASAEVGTPMAAGILRPTIFLPAAALDWHAERRDIVLAHEIAHLAARDPLRHLSARLALSCYWFHPLAWVAARQGMLAREQACDETVLALGTRPSTYARVLLDLAGSLRSTTVTQGALPMVERSLLETRLMAILNDSRPAIGRRTALPLVGMALLTCTVAAARPGASTWRNVGAGASAATAPAPTPAQRLPPGASAVVAAPTPTANVVSPMAAVASPMANVASPHADPAPATMASAVSAEQPGDRGESACGWWGSGSFDGSISIGRGGDREQIGSRGGDRVVQKSFGDLRLCAVAEGLGDRDWSLRPSQWSGVARRVILESRRGGAVQRLELVQREGGQQASWQVGGVERTFDSAAQQWRDRILAALDTTWELSRLRGQVSSLRGQISSIHGQESSLRGEISSLRGQVSSMRGQASSVRGEESSLRGRISSIQGHVSSLRGAISSERGAISGLRAAASIDDQVIRDRVAARAAVHDAEIARIEREIRDYGAEARIAAVEQEIKALDAAGKVAAIDAQIRAFDLDGKTAAVERRIVELDVSGKVAAIEREIEALDADRRGRELEARRDSEIAQLERAIAALR